MISLEIPMTRFLCENHDSHEIILKKQIVVLISGEAHVKFT